MENEKRLSVELTEMFDKIADKIASHFDNSQKIIEDKFDAIRKLRDEISNERQEMYVIGNLVERFSSTVGEAISTYDDDVERVDDALELLDDMDDLFDYEIGHCAECGCPLMKSDEPIVGDDGELYCDEDCEYDAKVIGSCDNCGSDILEDDDYVENEYGFFCCDSCAEEYYEDNYAEEEDESVDENEDEDESVDNE